MNKDSHFSLTRLSQGQLNLLETCPRKFQYIYLDQLGSPNSPEQQERIAWGSQFHLLMQQRELGLPIESFLDEHEQFDRAVQALIAAAPEILSSHGSGWREAEHCRTLTIQEYLLTAIYDLVVSDAQQATILDWKTYPQPKHRNQLAQNWQTRLYLYLLAETSCYEPEQLSMVYWFVKPPHRPQSLTFAYNRQQHEQTQQDLIGLLTRLRAWTERYHQDGIAFPQVSEVKGECDRCNFASSCRRSRGDREAIIARNWQAAIAEIEEVSL